VSLAMTKQEREDFLADLHVGIISILEEGRGPLTVPIWYSYAPGGEVRVVTGRTTRKVQLLGRARRFSLCAQTETWPYKYVSVEGPIVAIEPANLNAIAGRSLTVTSAFEQVTSTSRGREQRQMRTCLFVCVPSGGSRWTTGRYDRPSPEQLQWTGCVGPSVRTVCSASPTPWTRVGRRGSDLEHDRPTRPTPLRGARPRRASEGLMATVRRRWLGLAKSKPDPAAAAAAAQRKRKEEEEDVQLITQAMAGAPGPGAAGARAFATLIVNLKRAMVEQQESTNDLTERIRSSPPGNPGSRKARMKEHGKDRLEKATYQPGDYGRMIRPDGTQQWWVRSPKGIGIALRHQRVMPNEDGSITLLSLEV